MATHWRSRVALGCALVHAIVLLTTIFSETPLPPPSGAPCPPMPPGEACFDLWDPGTGVIVAGRYFHQDIVFNLLALVDLPAMAVGAGVEQFLNSVGVKFSRAAGSYFLAWAWLLFGTIQWWLLGIVAKGALDRRAAYKPLPERN